MVKIVRVKFLVHYELGMTYTTDNGTTNCTINRMTLTKLERLIRQRLSSEEKALQLRKYSIQYPLMEADKRADLHSVGMISWRAAWFHFVFPTDAKQRKEGINGALLLIRL